MKLMTKELEARFAKVGRQEKLGQKAVVIAKFFTQDSNWTWFATEYAPEERMFFGLVDGNEAELGKFSLDELEKATGPSRLHIERDRWWTEKTLEEVERGSVRR